MNGGKKFTICLTHDVDRVRKTHQHLTHDLRRGRARRALGIFGRENPYWNFERIMDLEDRLGVRSTWFFLDETIPFEPMRPANWKLSLGRYSVRERKIAQTIRQLDRGGWEIGLHGSFRSYLDGDLLKKEKALLEAVLGKCVMGIRQHYLNLKIPETWILQRAAGLEYDASFGYRRGLGWRHGRHQFFHDEKSGMWVLPLAIMESNLFLESGGDRCRAKEIAAELLDEAEDREAILTLLWHPHMFSEKDFPGFADVYRWIIEEGKRRGARLRTCAGAMEEYFERAAAAG